VLRHPRADLARVGQVGEVFVADDELHAGAGEGSEDRGIRVVELDAVHVQRLEEAGHLRRVGEVVRDLAVVDAELRAAPSSTRILHRLLRNHMERDYFSRSMERDY
jgi:hypothetical protein